MNSKNLQNPLVHRFVSSGWNLFIVTAAVLILASAAPAAQIGLKLGANGNGGLQASFLLPNDLAGAPGYEQTNWMSLGRWGDNGTAQFNVVDSAGNNTGVILNWDATGNWSVQGAGTATDQGSPDKNLMNAYDDSNGNGNTTLANTVYGNNNNNKPLIYISGLAAWLATQSVTNYDLVLYMDGDATAGRTGEYWIMNASGTISGLTYNGDMTTHVFLRDYDNFTGNPVYKQVPFTSNNRVPAAGNYTVFTGLSANSLLIRTSEFNTRCGINAIQIVPHAAPTGATIDPLVACQTYSGGIARFRANVAGVIPFTYQWQKDGVGLTDGGNIFGSLTASLTISNVSAGDLAAYSLVVTNPVGVVTSSAAGLTIVGPEIAGSYAEGIVNDAPVAYWRLNETADPSSGSAAAYDYVGGNNLLYGRIAQNGFNGVAGPQPTDFPGFESGNLALRSQNAGNPGGNPPYVSWAVGPSLNSSLNLNTNTVTVCAWIYPTAAQVANTAILSARGSDVFTFGYGNYGAEYNVLGYTWNGGQFNFLSFLVPPANMWSFVALVVSPTNGILYLYNANGQFSATNTTAHAVEAFAGVTMIGDDPSSSSTPQNRAFTGSIDEVAVFNRSLPQSELLTLYRKGLAVAIIPPVITVQPQPVGLMEGRTARFNIAASDNPLTYQWRKNGGNLSDGGNISGSLTPSLTISNVTIANNAAGYDIVLANGAGSVTSVVATLSVVVSNSTPIPYESKLRQFNPVAYWRMSEVNGTQYAYDLWGGNVATNENVNLGVTGPTPPDFSGIESTNTAAQYNSLSFADTASSVGLLNNRAQFSVIGWFNTAGTIGNRKGLFGQNDVVEFGFHGNGPDGQAQVGVFTSFGSAFLNQSTNVYPGVWYLIAAVGTGTNVSLYLVSTNGAGGIRVAQATGTGTTTNYGNRPFPFRIGGGGILDATSVNRNDFDGIIDEVAIFDRALSANEMSDLFGAALSGGDLPPNISSDPVSLTLYAGRTATFSVSALGTSPTYRWRTNGVPVPNAGNLSGTTTPTLTITNIAVANAAIYDVVITNRAGSITSAPATLTVITPVTAYEAAIMAANPIAYYRLNEMDDPSSGSVPANDYWGGHSGLYGAGSQNGFNAIQGPVPPDFSFEAGNTALATFNAAGGSYATAPFGTLSTNTVTMCMWIKPTGSFDTYAGLLVNRNSGIAGGFGFVGPVAGQLGYTWNNNNGATWGFQSGLVPPLNVWSFVSLVLSPTNAIISMANSSGIFSATNVLAHTSDVFGNLWRIGQDASDGVAATTRVFNGVIDEVGVFGYDLSAAQLQNLYVAGGGLLPVTLTITPSGPNVVLSWPQGTLLQATNVTGPWTTNIATSPYTTPATNTQTFYRVQVR